MIPGATQPACGDPRCTKLKEEWVKKFKTNKQITGKELNLEECDKCKKERAARTAVAKQHDDERFGQQPFSTAPYIHQLNDPKHAANLQRSVIWAETHQRSINWVTAHDYPLHRDDQVVFSMFVEHKQHSRVG